MNFKFHLCLGQLNREHFINVSKFDPTQGLQIKLGQTTKMYAKKCKPRGLGNETPIF